MRIPRFRRGAPPPAVDARAETIVQGPAVAEEEVPPGPPPPSRGPPPTLWTRLLLLLVLVAAGLPAVWPTIRDGSPRNATPVIADPDVVDQTQGKAFSRLKET